MKSVRLALLFLFISSFVFVSCKKNETKPVIPSNINSLKISTINPYAFSDSVLSKKTLLVYVDDSSYSFNGIFEDENYGIAFFVLKPLDSANVVKYQSELLDGISEGAEIDTLTLFSSKKFIYYSSGSAFIGSRNLEVYQYLFDPENKEIFKSYTTLLEDGSVLQIYSQNLKDKSKVELIHFFRNQIESKYIDDLTERKLKMQYE